MYKIQCIGNLTKDAQMKKANNGKTYLTFSVAVNERKENEGKTSYVDCSWFVDENSPVGKYMTKGKKVYLEGRPEPYWYTNKNTNEVVASMRCTVYMLEFCSAAQQNEQPSPQPTAGVQHPSDNPFGTSVDRYTNYGNNEEPSLPF